MRVQASAMAVALVAGALVAGAPVVAAQEAATRAASTASAAARARVSQWLSAWRANGGEVKGEAAKIGVADEEPPKAKQPRRTTSKKATRTARKAKPLKEASRPATTASGGAKTAAPPAIVAALPSPMVTPEPKPAAPEAPLPPATSRIHKQPDTLDEATWWRTEGEPAIVSFRDCIAAYAGREAPRRPDTSLGDLVIAAGAGDCRAPFEDMMTTLTVRYGRERLETAMGAILNETLLPAARAAADEASRSAGATDAAP